MRKRFEVQQSLGATPIEDIKIKHTRGSDTAVFRALQWIYSTPEVHEEIFELLESKLSTKQQTLGRRGMDLWTILVLGIVRVSEDLSYDRLHYSSNYDSLLRSMIGIDIWDNDREFSLTSLKENVSILTEDVLAEVNQIIAKHGADILQKKTKRKDSKQTATSLKARFISRLISTLPSMPLEKASTTAPNSQNQTNSVVGEKPPTIFEK